MATRKRGSLDLTFVRKYLEEFLSGVARREDEDPPDLPLRWQGPETTLLVSNEEEMQYRQLLKEAQRRLAPQDDVSERALDSALKDAVFTVVGTSAPDEVQREGRLNAAIADLRAFLDVGPQSYECWLEIEGPDVDTLPAGFGGTTFCVLNPLHIALLKDIVQTKHKVQVSEKLTRIDDQLSTDLLGRMVAIQCVNARDADAALLLAEREVQETLDCLNFVGQLVPYNRGHIRLARGRTVGDSGAQLTIAKDGSFTTDSAARIPWTFSFERLREVDGPASGVIRRIDDLLAVPVPNEVGDFLIRAVRWIGRAAEAESVEDKFLFSVVALESLLLPGRDGELKFRLSLIVARILGPDQTSRQQIASEVKKLYELRSTLVHDGRFNGTQHDQDSAVAIATQTIARLLTDDRVRTLTKKRQLEEYLNQLILE